MNRLGALAATVAALQSGCGDGTAGSAYGVVDPMPPPAQCMGMAGTITATAVWKAKEGGGLVIELTLGKPGRVDASYLAEEAGSESSAKIIAKQISADSVVLTLEPEPGATSAGVQIGAQCNQGKGHVSAHLNLAAPPAAGQEVPVLLSDTW